MTYEAPANDGLDKTKHKLTQHRMAGPLSVVGILIAAGASALVVDGRVLVIGATAGGGVGIIAKMFKSYIASSNRNAANDNKMQ